MQDLKIAVYTICKNEERFVDRWANSNSDADFRLVCDTGSKDNTVATLQSHNINVIPISVMPWRFDTARNTVLNLLPSDIDICISQDLDEELLPGWRTALEHKWHQNATIAYHRYRHNNNHWQWHSKIHARHGCWWTGIVHETLSWNRPDDIVWIENLFLDEHQDTNKSRSNYLQLILQKIEEGDKHWRTYYFLANEYENIGDIQRSIDSRKISYDRCDDGNTVLSYIAKNIARQYSSLNDQLSAEKWFMISINDSDEKESWFAYCQYLYNKKDWESCYIAAKKCISILEKRTGFTYDAAAWDWHVYDYAALSAYNIGLLSQAAAYGKLAVGENPGDERLLTNLKFYEQS